MIRKLLLKTFSAKTRSDAAHFLKLNNRADSSFVPANRKYKDYIYRKMLVQEYLKK